MAKLFYWSLSYSSGRKYKIYKSDVQNCRLLPFYNTFNEMQQFPKQTILYAFDVFTGPAFKTNIKEYIRFTLTPGIHYMYQLSDEYHLNYL